MAGQTKSPLRLEDPAIIERHDAVIGEIVLLKEPDGYFGIELVTPRAAGGFDRESFGFFKGRKHTVARRMMDIHSGICKAQYALGVRLPRNSGTPKAFLEARAIVEENWGDHYAIHPLLEEIAAQREPA